MLPYQNPQLKDQKNGEYLTDRLTDEVIDYIRGHKDDPFFVFLSFYSVHLPLQAKPEKVDKYVQKLERLKSPVKSHQKIGKTFFKTDQNIPEYAAMIESVDDNIGRILNELKQLQLDKNTIVVFTSDNGGMASSNLPDQIPTTNLPLRAGKGWLYEGGIKEPLILKYPMAIDAGTHSNIPVVATDLYPTLLDLAGLPPEKIQHRDGQSMIELIKSTNKSDRAIYWHYPHYSGGLGGRPSGAVRKGAYKLIEFYEDMRIELYDLAHDHGERNDLSAAIPEKAKELKTMLHKWRNEVDATMPIKNTAFKSE